MDVDPDASLRLTDCRPHGGVGHNLQRQSAYFRAISVGRDTFFVDTRYSDLKPIGDGSYGFVCSAFDNILQQPVAIKKVTDVFRDIGDAKRVLRELKLLRHFTLHENIVSILDIMLHPQDTLDFRDLYIVTNLMESDLDRIIASSQALTDQHHQYFLYQMLRGLKYIHSANVLHRDMKPSNLLVNANCDLAICDFGLARGVDLEFEDELTEYVVTRWYRAPELLVDSPHYGKTVDIWSVGCIFAEMLSRRPFFQGKNPMDQLRKIYGALGPVQEEDLSFVENQAAREVIMSVAAANYSGCGGDDGGGGGGGERGAVGPGPGRGGTGAAVPVGASAPSYVPLREAAQAMAAAAPPPPRRRLLADMLPPGCNPSAVDLLLRMLVLNPQRRITVEQALEHPYLYELHSQMVHAEPVCEQLFDFEFEKRFFGPKHRNIPLQELKLMMFHEMLSYRPSENGNQILAGGGGGALLFPSGNGQEPVAYAAGASAAPPAATAASSDGNGYAMDHGGVNNGYVAGAGVLGGGGSGGGGFDDGVSGGGVFGGGDGGADAYSRVGGASFVAAPPPPSPDGRDGMDTPSALYANH